MSAGRQTCPQCRGRTTEIGANQWMCLECSSRFSMDERGRPVIVRTTIPPKITHTELLERGNRLMITKELKTREWKEKARAHRDEIKSVQREWEDVQAAIKRIEKENPNG